MAPSELLEPFFLPEEPLEPLLPAAGLLGPFLEPEVGPSFEPLVRACLEPFAIGGGALELFSFRGETLEPLLPLERGSNGLFSVEC